MGTGSSDEAEFAIAIDRVNDVTVLHVRGEIDLDTASQLEAALLKTASTTEPVVLDLTDVTFLDSSGLSVLAQCRQRMAGAEGLSSLRLVVTRPAIVRIFEVTGLSDVFDVFASVDDASRGN